MLQYNNRYKSNILCISPNVYQSSFYLLGIIKLVCCAAFLTEKATANSCLEGRIPWIKPCGYSSNPNTNPVGIHNEQWLTDIVTRSEELRTIFLKMKSDYVSTFVNLKKIINNILVKSFALTQKMCKHVSHPSKYSTIK